MNTDMGRDILQCDFFKVVFVNILQCMNNTLTGVLVGYGVFFTDAAVLIDQQAKHLGNR